MRQVGLKFISKDHSLHPSLRIIGKPETATAVQCLYRSYADTLQMVGDGRGIVSLVFCASSVENGLKLMGGFRELERSKYQEPPAAVGTIREVSYTRTLPTFPVFSNCIRYAAPHHTQCHIISLVTLPCVMFAIIRRVMLCLLSAGLVSLFRVILL
jgi:hypothetical protein